jgi:hypothetical protein
MGGGGGAARPVPAIQRRRSLATFRAVGQPQAWASGIAANEASERTGHSGKGTERLLAHRVGRGRGQAQRKRRRPSRKDTTPQTPSTTSGPPSAVNPAPSTITARRPSLSAVKGSAPMRGCIKDGK